MYRGTAEREIFNEAKPGYRKIILSTNIAESSISIPDARYIIDFGLTKRNSVDKDTNVSMLKLSWCSQAEITQRAGRVGRFQTGKVSFFFLFAKLRRKSCQIMNFLGVPHDVRRILS